MAVSVFCAPPPLTVSVASTQASRLAAHLCERMSLQVFDGNRNAGNSYFYEQGTSCVKLLTRLSTLRTPKKEEVGIARM